MLKKMFLNHQEVVEEVKSSVITCGCHEMVSEVIGTMHPDQREFFQADVVLAPDQQGVNKESNSRNCKTERYDDEEKGDDEDEDEHDEEDEDGEDKDKDEDEDEEELKLMIIL